MHFSFYIIAAIFIVYAYQVLFNKTKPITGIYFYTQLFASIGLICLVWFNREPQTKIEYPILLTFFAAISITQCFLAYKKQRKVEG